MNKSNKELSGNKIFIVDDDELLLEMLVESLKENLPQIDIFDTASNGKEALEKVNKEYYAVIVSGIMMPGMNGIEFYNIAMQTDSDIKNRIIFMSGYDGEEVVSFIKANSHRWLKKPFQTHDLISMILEILKNQSNVPSDSRLHRKGAKIIMGFKLDCKKCGEILSGKNCYDVDPAEGTSITRPWYADETGLNHTALVCLKCGIIHDTTPSLLKVFIGSPFKVNGTIDPQGESLLEGYHGDNPEAYRKEQLRNSGISEDIIDALVNRKILGIAG